MTATRTAGLTARQREILSLIGEGHSNLEIQQLLFLSPNTIKTHIRRTYAQIGVRNRAQAVAWAFTHGLCGRGLTAELVPPARVTAPVTLQLVRV